MRFSMLIFLLIGFLANIAHGAGPQQQYQVGDRLPASGAASSAYQETEWDALIPKGWDPKQAFKGIDLGKLTDADPRAMDALQAMKDAWDNAPVESSLQGRRIRIAGFMIPLERKGDQVKEFLLVPYFGACIHAPPPPANQIIHVVAAKPLKGMFTMDAVWVSGTLGIGRTDSPWGAVGYKMTSDLVARYEKPKR